MKRHHIIPVAILAVVIVAFGAVYQFYVKEQIEEFAENQQRLEALNTRINELSDTFAGKDSLPVTPQEAVRQYRMAVQPWREEVTRRADFFTLGDSFEFEPTPEEQIPKFYYADKRLEVEQDLRQYAIQNNCQLNANIQFAPPPEAIENRSPSAQEVNNWLREFAFGDSIVRMLVDANAASIDAVVVWPQRVQFDLLRMRTTGLQFKIPLRDLIRFLEDFYVQSRYFNIDALAITNRNLLTQGEPQLNVDMVLTQAGFIREAFEEGRGGNLASGPGARARGGGGGGGDIASVLQSLRRGNSGDEQERVQQRSWWQNFRRKYLPF